ncbi:MAG: TolC family protein [Thermoanaerobaculia bacterium]
MSPFMTRSFEFTFVVAGSLLLGSTSPTLAEEPLALTLSEAQALALRQSPEYLAARQDEPIARGELRQARLPSSNPEVDVEAPGVGSHGSLSEYQISISQEFEIGGQRGLRARAAEHALQQARLNVEDTARHLLADVTAAYYSAFAAARRSEVAAGSLALGERLLEAVRNQLSGGKVSDLEANLTAIEAGRARGRLLRARREETAAQLELKHLIGLPTERAIRLVAPVPGTPDTPEARPAGLEVLMGTALAHRADLAARRAALAEAQVRLDLARREAVPNLRAGPLVERTADGGDSQVGAVVGLSLPLWNRNQGTVESLTAVLAQAQLDVRSAELTVQSEVARAYRAFTAADEEEAIFRTEVVNPTEENQRLLEIAYEAGKIDLPSLLLVRGQLLDAQLEYWEAWLAAREALTELREATGESSLAPTGLP